jgi:hypothetical protein
LDKEPRGRPRAKRALLFFVQSGCTLAIAVISVIDGETGTLVIIVALMHAIASVIDVQSHAGRRRRVGRHPLIDERVGQANDVLQARRVLEPRQGRLRAHIPAGVGQPPTGELERRIAAQVG